MKIKIILRQFEQLTINWKTKIALYLGPLSIYTSKLTNHLSVQSLAIEHAIVSKH